MEEAEESIEVSWQRRHGFNWPWSAHQILVMGVFFLNIGLLPIDFLVLLQQVQDHALGITWVTILVLEAALVFWTAFLTMRTDTTDELIY